FLSLETLLFCRSVQHLVLQRFDCLFVKFFSFVLILLLHLLSGPCVLRHESLLMDQSCAKVGQSCCTFLHGFQLVLLDNCHGVVWRSNLCGHSGLGGLRSSLRRQAIHACALWCCHLGTQGCLGGCFRH